MADKQLPLVEQLNSDNFVIKLYFLDDFILLSCISENQLTISKAAYKEISILANAHRQHWDSSTV